MEGVHGGDRARGSGDDLPLKLKQNVKFVYNVFNVLL